jgi:hypothetical protein
VCPRMVMSYDDFLHIPQKQWHKTTVPQDYLENWTNKYSPL